MNRLPSPISKVARLQPGSNEFNHSGRYSWPPTGAVVIRGDGTEGYPFNGNTVDWTPTGCKILSGDGTEWEPMLMNRQHSVNLRFGACALEFVENTIA